MIHAGILARRRGVVIQLPDVAVANAGMTVVSRGWEPKESARATLLVLSAARRDARADLLPTAKVPLLALDAARRELRADILPDAKATILALDAIRAESRADILPDARVMLLTLTILRKETPDIPVSVASAGVTVVSRV